VFQIMGNPRPLISPFIDGSGLHKHLSRRHITLCLLMDEDGQSIFQGDEGVAWFRGQDLVQRGPDGGRTGGVDRRNPEE